MSIYVWVHAYMYAGMCLCMLRIYQNLRQPPNRDQAIYEKRLFWYSRAFINLGTKQLFGHYPARLHCQFSGHKQKHLGPKIYRHSKQRNEE